MRYLLNDEFALRSFTGVPHCFYRKGIVKAQKLSHEEFDFLLCCDGEHELDEGQYPTQRVRDMVHPAEEGETLSTWSKYRHCDNRYFPGMIWMITGRCNYNCLHCFNAADNNPLASQWSWEDAQILMDEAQKCGINAFTITGGEPMLHSHFMDIVRGIHARGMFVSALNTNGAFLTPEVLEELKETGAKPLMKISFDGLGWHDWLRNRSGAEEKTLDAIGMCIEAGFPVKVQFNVHRENAGSLLETLLLLESMGVRETRIIRTSESPRWTELGKGQTLGFREYYEQMISFAKEWLKEPHTMKVTVWHMEDLPLITESFRHQADISDLSGWDRLKRYHPSLYSCASCRFQAAVTAEGDMVPCLQMSGRFIQDDTRLGNVKGGGLQKVFQEGLYLDTVCLRAGEVLEASPSCNQCMHFAECQGGCRAISIIMTGDYRGPDLARCIYYKEGYAKRLSEIIREAHSVV